MTVKPFLPQHPLLKDLVDYYYFQKTDSEIFQADYFAFPNNTIALNIHRNISFNITADEVIVTGVNTTNFLMVSNVQHTPLRVKQSGKIDKVTIVFKPLGLNHFINLPLNETIQKPTQVFSEWMDIDTTQGFLKLFYDENDHVNRLLILEDYLVSVYRPFQAYSQLKPIIDQLNDFSSEFSIENIALQSAVTMRTLNRLFKKHVGASPATFRKIARFRHSLNNKVLNADFASLTNISYESNFYDQSYFIKVYKHFTGQSPKNFFSSIDKLANNKLIFQFLK